MSRDIKISHIIHTYTQRGRWECGRIFWVKRDVKCDLNVFFLSSLSHFVAQLFHPDRHESFYLSKFQSHRDMIGHCMRKIWKSCCILMLMWCSNVWTCTSFNSMDSRTKIKANLDEYLLMSAVLGMKIDFFVANLIYSRQELI